MNNDIVEFEYSKLFNGTVLEKLKISKMFKENFKLLEKIPQCGIQDFPVLLTFSVFTDF